MIEVVALVTSLTVLATAGVTLVVTVLARRKVAKVEETVNEVHVLVNSRLQAVLERVEVLTAALERTGAPVPPDPGEQG